MKYFTEDLWQAMNQSDPELFQQSCEQWEKNRQQYWHQFIQLTPKLSKMAQRFFGKVSLHDSKVFSLSLGDFLDYDEKNLEEFNWPTAKTRVELRVLSWEGYVYVLRYTALRGIFFSLTYDLAAPPSYGLKIEDWGYDELTDAGQGYFRHEILFSSGASLAIEFKHFSYKRFTRNKPNS